MPSYKNNRAAEDIKRELCDILHSVKDPRVGELLSIVRVELSGDMSYATVYVSAIEGFKKTLESVAGLKSAAGYIRHELGERLSFRKTPELRFVADNSIEHSAKIAETLSKIISASEAKDDK